jgi:PAS domain S-box-containing protein
MGDDSKNQVSPIPIGGGPAALRALDARYEELKAARRAALNLLEDAVAANRRTEELVGELQREVETRKRVEEALRESEARHAFLLRMSDAVRTLVDAAEIEETVTQMALDHFRADRCFYCEIDGERPVIWRDALRGEIPSVAGVCDLEKVPIFKAAIDGNRPSVVEDVRKAELVDEHLRELCVRMGVISSINVPVTKGDSPVGIFCVAQSSPRVWSEVEVALAEEIAERTWSAVARANAEQSAKEFDQRLRMATEATHLGIWEWNLDTNRIAWNEHHYRMMGIEPGSGTVDASVFFNRIHPEDREHLEEEIRQAVREARVFDAVFRVVQDSGAVRWMSGYGRLTESGDGLPMTMSGVMMDVTDRTRIEEDLRISNERLRLLIESATDVSIFTTDRNGIVNSWNSGSARIYGFADEEIIGRDVAVLFTDEDRKSGEHLKEMEEAIRSGRALDERWHKRKDGTMFFASGLTQPIGDGGAEGFVKIARDMTDRLRAEKARREKELMQTLVNAQELERRRIARDLHDELGQQLTALRLKLDRVSDEAAGPLEKQITEVKEIAKNLDEGVDFLAWELRPAALDDLGLVPAIEKFAKEWSAYSGVAAEVTASASAERRFDPAIETALYRIVQEALNNVHKHAKANGAGVTLRTHRGKVVLVIDDDGKGFDPNDPSTRTRGMGLVGMNERVQMIGGTLEIESEPGRGTTLFVKAPATS